MSELWIKSIVCGALDLARWEPEDLAEVYLGIELEIGEADGEAADIFQLVVCTPEALAIQTPAAESSIIRDRATLIVARFDWREIESWIEETVRECSGEDWIESLTNLQKFFMWEYENYVQE